ncbi:MAG: type III pantothenate kinase [Saprospiraceae bacterium]|nr:MAG: type III pantothenate kinase [Saprospiraceae bacterium]
MTLAIDIGNTNVVIGLSEGEQWPHVWRFPTLSSAEEAQLFYPTHLGDHLLEAGVGSDDIKQVIISSVVPILIAPFVELIQQFLEKEPIVLGRKVYEKLPLSIENKDEIGADLVANAMAAHRLYQRDIIVVDFGTALTFTTLNAKGALLGVAIAPGLKTAMSVLHHKTAQLPEVPLGLPDSALGRNTVHAIQSGVLIGYVGLVRNLLASIRAEVGPQYIAIATGGLSTILYPLRDDFFAVDPHLTLHGLRLIGECINRDG